MNQNKPKTIIYKIADNQIDVIFKQNTVWLSQKQMAELFNRDRKTITEHLQNIFDQNELIKSSVCWKFQHTASDGKQYEVIHYNLDAIISVGYRTNPVEATQFRVWAKKKLKRTKNIFLILIKVFKRLFKKK